MVSKALYPFENHYLKIDGFKYHYLDEGRGDPVVMIHGNPTWSFYFRNLIQALKSQYRTIAPDHIGCGLSDKPSAKEYSYTLKKRVSDLEALIDALKLDDKITLVVHDWGGMIGMTYACRYPQRIKKLIILNTAAFHLPKDKALPWQLKIIRNTSLGPFLVQGLNLFNKAATRLCLTRKPMSRSIRKEYLSPYNNWDNRIAVLKFVQDIPLSQKDPSYELVSETQKNLFKLKDIPMLICWGAKDFVFDDTFLERWHELFPHAMVHRFSDAGHYILEDAWEEVVPLVKHFLDNHKPVQEIYGNYGR